MENSKYNIEFILKLFDQVKSSSDKTDKEVEHLASIIREFMNQSNVSNEDLSLILNKMNEDLNNKNLKMASCSNIQEKTQDNIKEIKDDIKDISKKLRTMIIIVCVAFGLMVASYLFVRNSVNDMIDRRIYPKIEKEQQNIDSYDKKIYKILEGIKKHEENEHESDGQD